MCFKNIFKIFICINLILFFIIPVNADTIATVHGEVYNWETFEPVENAIVTVNSTPRQSVVAEYGVYTFNLAPGNYQITAKSYQNGSLVYQVQENIIIKNGGDYALDLLLMPVYNRDLLNDTESSQITESFENDSNIIDSEEDKTSPIIYVIPLVVVLLVAFFFIRLRKYNNRQKEVMNELPLSSDENYDFDEEPVDTNSLPDDLQKVFDVVKDNGGRITQKDLRNRLIYSEAKISLMISDLEERGYVEKFKKGRGNIVRIVDELNDENQYQ